MPAKSLFALTLAATLALQPLTTFAASGPHLTGLAAVYEGGKLGDAVDVTTPLLEQVVVGDRTIPISFTTMAVVHKLFGGKLNKMTADTGMPESWACYDAEGIRTTFFSDTSDHGKVPKPSVSLVVEELADTPAAAAGCTTVSAALVPIANSLPGLGATAADLVAAFGDNAVPDDKGLVNISYQMATRDHIESESVFYQLTNGTVIAVGFGRWQLYEGDL